MEFSQKMMRKTKAKQIKIVNLQIKTKIMYIFYFFISDFFF